MLRSRTMLVAIATTACIAGLGGTARPATAAESSGVEKIAGYTATEFIDAADRFGYADVAEKAWGDIDAMSEIPVASVTETGPTLRFPGVGSSSDDLDWLSGSCSQIVRNVLGNNIYVLRVNKTWQTDGVRVFEFSSAHATETAWGWFYEDLVTHQEYYQPLGSVLHGMHISQYAAKFTHSVPPPESRTIWASVNASSVGHGCSGGES